MNFLPRLSLSLSLLLFFLPLLSGQQQNSDNPPAKDASQTQQNPPSFSLDDFLNSTKEKSKAIRIAQAGLSNAQANYDLTSSRNLLSVGATAGYTGSYASGDPSLVTSLGFPDFSHNATAGITLQSGAASSPQTSVALAFTEALPTGAKNSPNRSSLSVTANQVVLDGYPGGQGKAVLDKAFINVQIKALQTQQSENDALLAVHKAYLQMLSAQRLLDVRKNILISQKATNDQVQAQADLKQASRVDLLNAQINAESAQLDVESAEQSLLVARQNLLTLSGLETSPDFMVQEIDDPVFPVASVDEALNYALKNRPELNISQFNQDSSFIDYTIANGANSLGISLTGSFNYVFDHAPNPGTNANSLSLGAKFRLPIWDSGAQTAQISSTNSLIQLYSLQRAQYADNINTEVRNDYQLAIIAQKKIELSRRKVDLAKQRLNVITTQNQYGTATTYDMLTASVTAANAANDYETARGDYLLAILNLQIAMGVKQMLTTPPNPSTTESKN